MRDKRPSAWTQQSRDELASQLEALGISAKLDPVRQSLTKIASLPEDHPLRQAARFRQRSEPTPKPAKKRRRHKASPQRDAVARVLAKLFTDGVPSQDLLSNDKLVWMVRQELPGVSRDTVLRAAGRRKG